MRESKREMWRRRWGERVLEEKDFAPRVFSRKNLKLRNWQI